MTFFYLFIFSLRVTSSAQVDRFIGKTVVTGNCLTHTLCLHLLTLLCHEPEGIKINTCGWYNILRCKSEKDHIMWTEKESLLSCGMSHLTWVLPQTSTSSVNNLRPARVALHLQHRGSSVCITAAQSHRKEGAWEGQDDPGSPLDQVPASPGPVIPDLTVAAPPTSCSDNGQSQGEPSSGLIGRQWSHSPPPLQASVRGIGESHTRPNCHLAWDRLRQAWAGATMDVLTSVHVITKGPSYRATMLSLSFSPWKNCFIHSARGEIEVDCDGSTWERSLSNDWAPLYGVVQCVWSHCGGATVDLVTK